MRVLFLTSDLTYGGAAKQLLLLAEGLPQQRFECRVCVLRRAGPWAESLREAGVIVDVLNRRWQVDLPAFRALWSMLRAYQADVLHVWGRFALRSVALAGGLRRARLFVTTRLPPGKPRSSLLWWDRWLLRRAEWVTAWWQRDAESWRRSGLDAGRVIVVPLGVELPHDASPPSVPILPAKAILCIGPLESRKGFRDAVWVLDMLRHLHPQLHLAFVGGGPDQQALLEFARAARVADRVHFLGERQDLSNVLAEAELVWAPSRAEAGINAVLEAMAAGKPVVASGVRGLAEIVADGDTGFLVPPADQAALARQTRRLLEDADLRRRMGEAARRRAAKQFGAAEMVQRFAELYEARR
jgi:glycosyltransferase involved in cell wall biosynthesis